MTTTPKSMSDEYLNESWVEVGYGNEENVQARNTPIPAGMIYQSYMEKLLLEAQRESNQASAMGSEVSSHRDSPKSPPSPNPACEPTSSGDIIINKDEPQDRQIVTDWIWDWSSRPDQQPPKEWKFKHPQQTGLSLRHSKAVKHGLFSTEVLSVLFFTNLLSLLLGTGIGIYIGKRLSTTFSTISFN